MNFLTLADKIKERTDAPDEEGTPYRMVVQSAAQAAEMAQRLNVTEDEALASVIAMFELGGTTQSTEGGQFPSAKEFNSSADPEMDIEETEDDKKASLPERVVRWFLKRVLKRGALVGTRIIIRSLYSVVRWFAKELVVTGLRWAGRVVLRTLLVDSLAFMAANVELWPVLAAAAGAVGLGYWIYKRFFDESAPDVEPGHMPDYDGQEEPSTAPSRPATPAPSEAETQAPAPAQTQPLAHAPQVRPSVQTPKPSAAPMAQPAPDLPAGSPVATETPVRPPEQLPPPQVVPETELQSYVKPLIARHEGRRNAPYKDSLGLWTVGIGHLIGDGKVLPPEWNRHFSDKEIDELFASDYPVYERAAETIPNFNRLNIQGKAALVDITFNMGVVWWQPHGRSRGFPRFTEAMQEFNLPAAISSLQNSRWYTQVGNRGREDMDLLKTNITTGGPELMASTSVPAPKSSKAAKSNPEASPTHSSGPDSSKDKTLVAAYKGYPLALQ